MLAVPHVRDLAYGSATTNNSVARGLSGYNSSLPVPDVPTQVHDYLASVHGRADPHALYIVSGGSNDAFFGLGGKYDVKQLADRAVQVLGAETERLARHGAKHVLVPTLGSTAKSPYERTYGNAVERAASTLFTEQMNSGLRALVARTKSLKATLFDVHQLETAIQRNPAKHGLTDVKHACLVGAQKLEVGVKRSLCSDPTRYFYFDLYHPTAHVHRLLARGAAKALASVH